MRLEVLVCKAPRQVERLWVDLPTGATVLQALQAASSALPNGPDLSRTELKVGVWGRACRLSQPLGEGDRVEVYRALTADPKDARRRRFAAQKAQRPHAKSGRPL
jgi:putative ubiquitin-RnfH superfamily antitoxin RatB of RatAB toxin-antitoxin module